MKRSELQEALRAAAHVARESEFILIGSQAIHACCRRPPAEVLLSQECDLYPRTYVLSPISDPYKYSLLAPARKAPVGEAWP